MTRISGRTYVITWLGLLGLTGVSFGVTELHLPTAPAITIALAIASVKACWVALVFMHLLEERFANRMTLATAVTFVAILCSLMVGDVMLRHTGPPIGLPRAAAVR